MDDRAPILAGTFYPAEPAVLAASVDSLLHAGTVKAAEAGCRREKVLAVMLPHAGHVYCGRVVGETLSRAALPQRLIILCPSHTGRGAPLAVWPRGAWHTPLGRTPVDAELAEELLETDGGYRADREAHGGEHAIEVLLPFLQRALPDASIVPIVVSVRPDRLQAAGEALARVLASAAAAGRPAAVIVSSDMHHFGDEPTTLRQDEKALEPLLHLDPAGLYNTVARERISMCGVLPATLALFAGRTLGMSRAELVAHTTSAEASGETDRVVGYAGVLFR